MKVLRRQISSKDGDGFVQMKTEEAEDMWHAYNLIAAGDRVRTSTVRKVRCEFAVSCYQDARSKYDEPEPATLAYRLSSSLSLAWLHYYCCVSLCGCFGN